MITRINDLQSPFFGQKLHKNAALEYEEDGEIRIRVFFSQKQGMEILDLATDVSTTCVGESYANRILHCGLPVSSPQDPLTIHGIAARLLHRAREAFASIRIMFASDSVERVLVFLQTFEGIGTICILFVIDETTARHLYIIHGQDEARSVLEKLRHIGAPGVYESRLEQIRFSELPKYSEEPTLHIEHDAASYLGTHIESFWILLTTPSYKHLLPA